MRKIRLKKNAVYLIIIIISILALSLGLGLGLKKHNNSNSSPTERTITADEAKSKALAYANDEDNTTKVPNHDETWPITKISVINAEKNPKKSGEFIVDLTGLVFDIQQSDKAVFAVSYNGVYVLQEWGQGLWPVTAKICGCPLIGTYDNTNNKNNNALLSGFSIDKNHTYNDITIVSGNTDGFDKNFNMMTNLYKSIGTDGTLNKKDAFHFAFNENPVKNNPFVSVNLGVLGIEKLTENGIKVSDGKYIYLGWTSTNPDKIYFVFGTSSDGKATSITNNANDIKCFYYSSKVFSNSNGGALDVEYSKQVI